MTAAAGSHLTDAVMTEAVATGRPLEPAVQQHVDHCDRCRDGLTRLAEDVRRLRDGARGYAPTPTRPLSLPETIPGGSRRRPYLWGAGIGAAAAGVVGLVLFFSPLNPVTQTPGPATTGPIATYPGEDSEMEAIRMLAENAMPASYQAISESLDHQASEEEGFIDFLIPPLTEESVS
ncbi:MAG: hypothetical protein PVH30_13135 [Desulfobacterales bacterium]